MTDTTSKARRGFAAISREANAEISRKGGRAAHAAGTAHEWTRDEASEAGRLGGLKSSANRAHMAEIGRRGGRKRGENIAAQKARDEGEALADAASL